LQAASTSYDLKERTEPPTGELAMPIIDLKPAASRLAELVAAVPDSTLGNPTPCTDYTVGDLLDHIRGLTIAFGGAARKASGETATMGPAGNATELPGDWRTALPEKLMRLAREWDAPDAWTGVTKVGGQEAPAEAIGVIAFGELSVHGWDLSKGTGVPFEPDPTGVAALYELTSGTFSGTNGDAMRGTAFGAAVPVAEDAPVFDRALGVLGRDPRWSAAYLAR
jgi:uncharacterized protein (TIGR03086 family)